LARVAGYTPRWYASPKTVTRPNTNQPTDSASARIELTITPLPLNYRATLYKMLVP